MGERRKKNNMGRIKMSVEGEKGRAEGDDSVVSR